MFVEAYDKKKLKLCEFVKRVGGHNIHTPFELTEEIVNTIEADEKTKVAVLFNIEFVFTLIALKGVDPKKITFFGDCPKKQQLVESLGCVYVDSNVLLDKKEREKYKMKFDAVVGNPPYELRDDALNQRNREFYMSFVRQAHELAPHVGMVYPARWTPMQNPTFAKFAKELIDANLTHFRWLPFNTFNVQMLTCYTVTNSAADYTSTCVINEVGESINVNVLKLGYIPSEFGPIELLTKMRPKSATLESRAAAGRLYENQMTAGNNPIVFRAGRASDPVPNCYGSADSQAQTALVNKHKVVMSRNGAEGKLGPVKVCDPAAGLGFACFGLMTNSTKESQNLVSYLTTKPVKFIVDQYKRGTKGNTKSLFAKIADVDLSRPWTDNDVYDLFNLTDDERKYINDNY